MSLPYTFNNEALRTRALTHRSKAPENYERLEFLGDRLVNTIVAEALLEHFPNEPEGQIAKRHASLVRTETLAELAIEAGLNKNIVMSTAEATAGGATKPSILADVFEATAAAIYLDSDFNTLRTLLRPLFAPRLDTIQIHDAKTHLQEVLQAEGLSLPTYTVTEEHGQDHNKHFTIRVDTKKGQAEGQGPSKKAAEQAAATALLQALNIL